MSGSNVACGLHSPALRARRLSPEVSSASSLPHERTAASERPPEGLPLLGGLMSRAPRLGVRALSQCCRQRAGAAGGGGQGRGGCPRFREAGDDCSLIGCLHGSGIWKQHWAARPEAGFHRAQVCTGSRVSGQPLGASVSSSVTGDNLYLPRRGRKSNVVQGSRGTGWAGHFAS